MIFFKHPIRIFLILIALTLAACGKKAPDGPSSTTLDRAALMQLAFPGWTASGPGHKQTQHIPAEESHTTDAKGKQVPKEVAQLVEPVFVVRLSDDDASMIFRAYRELGNPEQGDSCNTCSKQYGAVQFHRYDGNWYLTNRQDVFVGTSNLVADDSAEIVKLSQHAFALEFNEEEGHMGEDTKITQLFELKPDGPHELLEHYATTMANNDSGVESSCEDALAKMGKHQPLVQAADTECWHIETKRLLDAKGETPGDLILQYTGLIRTNNKGKDKQYQYHRINEQQVWHYEGGKYIHVSGSDPYARVDG